MIIFFIYLMSIHRNFFRILTTVSLCFSVSTSIELYPIARPIGWNTIFQLYSKDIPAGTTFRSMKGQELYSIWKGEMKSKNISGSQFVKEKILGFGGNPQKQMYFIKSAIIADQQVSIYTTGELDYLKEFQKDTDGFKERIGISRDSSFILIAINNFPYDLEDGVHHLLVWSNKHYDLKIIEEVLGEVLYEQIEIQLYQNALHLKSIPQISHYQLFIRKRPIQSTDL